MKVCILPAASITKLQALRAVLLELRTKVPFEQLGVGDHGAKRFAQIVRHAVAEPLEFLIGAPQRILGRARAKKSA